MQKKLRKTTEEESITLLAADSMLVKHPILFGDNFVAVGFKEYE